MKKFFLFFAVLFLIACQSQTQGNLIVFSENEEGVDPYQTRIISTRDYLRIDDGEGSQDYIIYDRNKQAIYSISFEMHSVMVVQKKSVDLKPPIKLTHKENDLGDMKGAPKINGRQPRHYQYVTNGQVCVDVVSVKGLMPDTLKGMREYQAVLASDSAVTFGALPADLHDPCDISMSTFAPTRHLQNGFPVQEWKPGYSRILVDYKQGYKADPKLFELPKGYHVYKVQDLRSGKVDFIKREPIPDEQGENQP